MTLIETLTIVALIGGPIAAVQLTRFLDDQKEVRNRKLYVFKILMASRATILAPQHVEALNRVPLEFTDHSDVMSDWHAYLDHLGNTAMEAGRWNEKQVDLLVDMLHTMGKKVGYNFDKTEIKNGVYNPQGHGRVEQENTAVRQGLAEVFSGKRAFPITITNLPDRAPDKQ